MRRSQLKWAPKYIIVCISLIQCNFCSYPRVQNQLRPRGIKLPLFYWDCSFGRNVVLSVVVSFKVCTITALMPFNGPLGELQPILSTKHRLYMLNFSHCLRVAKFTDFTTTSTDVIDVLCCYRWIYFGLQQEPSCGCLEAWKLKQCCSSYSSSLMVPEVGKEEEEKSDQIELIFILMYTLTL